MSRLLGSIAVTCVVFAGTVFPDLAAWGLRPLSAATISFQLSGILTHAESNGATAPGFAFAPEVVQGAPFTGLLTYDLSTPFGKIPPGAPHMQSYFQAPPTGSMGLSITVGSQTFATNPQAGFSIHVTNAVPDDPLAQVDQFFFSSARHDPVGDFFDNVSLNLLDPSGGAFSSPSLPTMLNVADFDMGPFSREFQIIRTGGAVSNVYPPGSSVIYSLGGTIDTITLVPEPSTLALGALGLLAWRILLRKPRSSPARNTQ